MLKETTSLALCSLVTIGILMLIKDCLFEGLGLLVIVIVVLAAANCGHKQA